MDLKGKSLITTIRTSVNEAVNCVKLNYTDKKTDYPKSFAAQYALAVIHNNNGIIQAFELIQDKREYNIAKINQRNQIRAQKICEQKKKLEGFDFDQDLVPYGIQIQNDIQTKKFCSSFSLLVKDFDSTLMCYGCQSFSCKFPNGFCKLCGFYFCEYLMRLIPNATFHDETLINSTLQIEKLDSLLKNIYGFENF
ncbi:9884_t:CDS:2 [Funneliformis geosporum]|uniref:9884_t:CDS:1 n=1 Tax=Funneliformis geosporum TaxID=1117311 RepID=A0A9W4SYE2_9GLOM|nr:9884_t:CDS:2 [Funneliformis geosporum]